MSALVRLCFVGLRFVCVCVCVCVCASVRVCVLSLWPVPSLGRGKCLLVLWATQVLFKPSDLDHGRVFCSTKASTDYAHVSLTAKMVVDEIHTWSIVRSLCMSLSLASCV